MKQIPECVKGLHSIEGQPGLFRDQSGQVTSLRDYTDATVQIEVVHQTLATLPLMHKKFLVSARSLVLYDGSSDTRMRLFCGGSAVMDWCHIEAFSYPPGEGSLHRRIRRLEAALSEGLCVAPFGELRCPFYVLENEQIIAEFDKLVSGVLTLEGVAR